MSQRSCLRLAGVVGALAVILGAFGAHGLENRLSAEMLAIYHTGVTYHFYHALALLALAVADARLWQAVWTGRAALAWAVGIAIFSGSLYVLAVTEIRWLGAITPIGGLCMIAGWVLLVVGARSLPNWD